MKHEILLEARESLMQRGIIRMDQEQVTTGHEEQLAVERTVYTSHDHIGKSLGVST